MHARHAAGITTDPNEVTILCSPSDLCSSKKWGPLQFRDGLPAFACFRPAVLPPHALPARLISPIFASFLRDIDVTDLGPCPAEGEAIAGLVGTMACAFSSEVERVRAFTVVLDRYLGCKLTSLKPDAASSSASADACIVGGDNAYLQVLLEAKNELGSADPWFQGQRHYQTLTTGGACARLTRAQQFSWSWWDPTSG